MNVPLLLDDTGVYLGWPHPLKDLLVILNAGIKWGADTKGKQRQARLMGLVWQVRGKQRQQTGLWMLPWV